LSEPAWSVLRERNVRAFIASRFCTTMALTLLRATLAWQVFAITGSAYWLGLLGLAQFIPTLALSLAGGAVADAYDRRRIMLIGQCGALACALGQAWVSAADMPAIAAVGLVSVLACFSSFENPASSALLPQLVPTQRFAALVSTWAATRNLAWFSGPVLSGFLIEAGGAAAAFAASAALIGAALLFLLQVRPRTAELQRRAPSFSSVLEGVAFVRGRKLILTVMLLDMFAVIFASVTALLPIYASQILQVGPRGYGLLAGSLQVGTFLMALLLVVSPPIRNPGRALLLAVAGFGLATILFGASTWYPLSIAALIGAGMSDEVSMVARQMIIQLSTPDELRGRVASVNFIFVGASNQLGDVESGLLAGATSPMFTAVFGGAACLVVLAWAAFAVPELRSWRPGDATPQPTSVTSSG
jgi:MFS family permease